MVLGTEVNAESDDGQSLEHRQAKAEKLYWRNCNKFRCRGHEREKMHAWNQSSGTVAAYGLGGLALTKELLRSTQAWENRMLRRIYRRKWGSTLQTYYGESAG